MKNQFDLQFNSPYDEYKGLITSFISSIHPEFHTNIESKVDAIMELFIASRNIRLGPAPTIEQQFEMRKVIRYYLHENEPIPVHVPSGPKKTIAGHLPDLAELSMLNILNCLHTAVRRHHEPGLQIVLRLEDMTGAVLEPEYTNDMERYTTTMIKLIEVLGYSNFIDGWLESRHPNAEYFVQETKKYANDFFGYILDSNGLPPDEWNRLLSWKTLEQAGWKGMIPMEQRQMYLDKYKKLYPERSVLDHTDLMCKYFGAALARKNLKMTGALDVWTGGCLDIAFMQPVAGYSHPTRFYYRSVELKNSKMAIPFWRAKGFLKIGENNNIRISSCTWQDAEKIDFFPGNLIFRRGNLQVKIECDYMLEADRKSI